MFTITASIAMGLITRGSIKASDNERIEYDLSHPTSKRLLHVREDLKFITLLPAFLVFGLAVIADTLLYEL